MAATWAISEEDRDCALIPLRCDTFRTLKRKYLILWDFVNSSGFQSIFPINELIIKLHHTQSASYYGVRTAECRVPMSYVLCLSALATSELRVEVTNDYYPVSDRREINNTCETRELSPEINVTKRK